MRIQIKATGFEMTPSLQLFVEEKIMGLEKYVSRWDEGDGVIVRVEVAKTTNHHQKGLIFRAEANLDLPKQVIRVEETNEDMHKAVEAMKDSLKTEILKVKEKAADHKI